MALLIPLELGLFANGGAGWLHRVWGGKGNPAGYRVMEHESHILADLIVAVRSDRKTFQNGDFNGEAPEVEDEKEDNNLLGGIDIDV